MIIPTLTRGDFRNMIKIKIQDESGDKKYFTQIPNYIANHSTANDQALYFQMKRYAGEDGQCFATEKTLMKKLGIGKKAYDKSLNYLLEKKWIRFIGTTEGKTRPIKTYSIVDIWKINILEYEEISAESNISLSRDKFQKEGDKSQKHTKISAESNIEEEPVLRRTNNKMLSKDNGEAVYGNPDINDLLETFKREFELGMLDGSQKENRQYAKLMIQKCGGLEIAKKVISVATRDDFYGNQIASVKKLYYKMAEIVQKAKGKKDNVLKIR